jgi:hypothetical protein
MMDSSDRLTELKTLGYIISVGLIGKLECAGWSRCEERGEYTVITPRNVPQPALEQNTSRAHELSSIMVQWEGEFVR